MCVLKKKEGGGYFNHNEAPIEYQAHHQLTIALHRVNEIVPPNFLINLQTHGVESSCGHRQRLQCSLPGDMNIKEGSCSELSRVSLLGEKLQRETDVLRMGLCHFSCVSQLSFNTLIYKRRRGGLMNLL